jgi:hypothetical protein
VNSKSIVGLSNRSSSTCNRPKKAAHERGEMRSSRSVLGWASNQLRFF